jgi:uroporphyrinogen-III synthase
MPTGLPLEGQKVVVTRARSQADKLATRLEAAGAMVIEFETIDIEYKSGVQPYVSSKRYDWIVLTSANGVRGLARVLDSDNRKLADLRPAKFFAVGPSTASTLRELDVEADLIPADFIAEGGVDALKDAEPSWEGKRVLFACAQGARRVIPNALRAWGAEVDSRVVYETVRAKVTPDRVDALMSAEPQWLTFASGSTATNFAAIVGDARIPVLLESAAIASIGPQTTQACDAAGLPVTIEAKRHDIDGLVEAIVNFVSHEGG